MAKLTNKMQFKKDIATVEIYIRKKDNVERMRYVLCDDNEKYKIQQINTENKERYTLAESKFKYTALKIFAEIFANDIKEFIKNTHI